MDLYMAGSTFKELNDWMRTKSFNKLLSQLNDRGAIEEWGTALRLNKNCKSKLFIDSGAFTAHTKGSVLDVDEYIEFCNKNDDIFTVFAQVDKIPGTFGKPYTKEELLEAPDLSWQNYLYMAPKCKSRDKLIPIFHQQEDFKWLRNMLEYTHPDTGEHIKYIGISTRNDCPRKEKELWLTEVFNIIARSSNPNVKTHAFGMTSFPLLEKFPFTSADSTAWIMVSVNGNIYTDVGTILVSDNEKSLQNPKHFNHMEKDAQNHIRNYVESRGFKIEQLASDYKYREYFNILYMNEWAKNYKYTGGNKKINKLF